MKLIRHNRKLLRMLLVVFLLAIASYSVFTKSLHAKEQIFEFCRMFGVEYANFKSSFSLIMPGQSRVLFSAPSIRPSCGDVAVSFDRTDARGNKIPDIYFLIGRKSNEIEMYSNRDLYYRVEKKYGFKAWPSTHDVDWPQFMSEVEAQKIANSLAAKLNMPSDMALKEMKKNDKNGIWTAVWRRELNGYLYENDYATVAIMGTTGEFVEYVKHYEGKLCPTVVRISEAEALNRGWQRFIKKAVPEELRSQAHVMYGADVSLRIVQPNIFGRWPIHIKSRNSRLAWIVSFFFTGGVDLKESEHPTDKELEASSIALGLREKRWFELGKPQREYEIRYDAETGNILESSIAQPAWFRGMAK